MIYVVGVRCLKCRGTAYLEEGALSCLQCGRLLALLALRPEYTTG